MYDIRSNIHSYEKANELQFKKTIETFATQK